jgi:hypothetical protein
MAEPRTPETDQADRADADPTVPEEATEEPHILSDEDEDERGARREFQQEHAAHPIWPMADDPLRQGGESSPPPAKRRH